MLSPSGTLTLPGRTPRSKAWIGTSLLAAGVLLVLVAIGPLSFMHRITDRAEVPGIVKVGYSFESVASSTVDGVAELADGESGYWKVDYEIDGSKHTGLIRGSYSVGQEVIISAPGDGSPFRFLEEADAAGIKVLGWSVALAALGAIGVGIATLVSGLRAAGRQHQLEANQRIAATLGVPVEVIEQRLAQQRRSGWSKGGEPAQPPTPAANGTSQPQWQQVRSDRPSSSAPTGFFHRPYDLDE